MERTDCLEGIVSAIPVLFWIVFGLVAGPKMTPHACFVWTSMGAIVVALTWWQSARAARDSRQLKELIAKALGIPTTAVSASTEFEDILARKIRRRRRRRRRWHRDGRPTIDDGN
jgi:hypothetical protein